MALLAVAAWPRPGTAGYADAQAAIAADDLPAAHGACADAAEGGDPDCENVLGWLALQDQAFGGPEAARQWFARAAGRGHAQATANLAFMWARGLGGPVDVERAASLYRTSRTAALVQVEPEPQVRSEPQREVSDDRLTVARYRGAYAELLRLRVLEGLRSGASDRYVSAAELQQAETVLGALASEVEDRGADTAEIRASVEKEQALMLRLLGRHADAFDPAVRADAEKAFRRILAVRGP
jgi:hypothetical protein